MLFSRLYRYVLRSFNRHSTDRGFVQSNSFQSVRRTFVLTTKPQSSKHALLSRRNFGKNPLHSVLVRQATRHLHEMDIMTLLGHTTLQMTSRYTHAMPQNLRAAVDALNKRPLPFRPRSVANRSGPKSHQVATGTDGVKKCDLNQFFAAAGTN